MTLGLALWGATGVMSSIQKSLAVVFDEGVTRSFVRGRLVSALLVLGVLGLMLVAVAISMLGRRREEAERERAGRDGLGALRCRLPLRSRRSRSLLTFGVFFGADARGCRTRGRRCARRSSAAGAGALGFQAIQAGLAWYLSGPANFSAIYGSASAVFAFLLSIYLGASAFVVGAVLTSVRRRPGAGVA